MKISAADIFKKEFIVASLVILAVPWSWKIVKDNLLLGALLISITFLLIRLLLVKKPQSILIVTFCIIFIFASLISIRLGLDQSFRKLNFNEEVQQNDRFGFYSKESGKLFLNKYTLNFYKNYNPDINKFERNFFSGLDLNLYFFASHPRERAGVYEFEKFPPVLVVFFIIGIIHSLQLQSFKVLLYLIAAALINGVISPGFELGPVLFFPLITTLTVFGVIRTLIFLRGLVRKKSV